MPAQRPQVERSDGGEADFFLKKKTIKKKKKIPPEARPTKYYFLSEAIKADDSREI